MVQLYSRLGGEFVVNTSTDLAQSQPAMVRLASGQIVIVWTSAVSAATFQVRGQLFAADGSPVGGEFAVSPVVAALGEARVEALTTGGFVATWTVDLKDGTGTDSTGRAQRIHGQLFDASANMVGGELTITSGTGFNDTDSQLVALPGGAFAVGWAHDTTTNGLLRDLFVQAFDPQGAPTGAPATLSASTSGVQASPAFATLPGGGFVATWADANSAALGDGSSFGVKAQLFTAAGAKSGGELLVNTAVTGPQTLPSVAGLPSGGFVVAWQNVAPVGDPAQIDVKAQIFDAAGARVGGEFLVTADTAGVQAVPAVTALSDGRFVIAWRDDSSGDSDVKAQVFDATGAKVGIEFLLGSETAGLQNAPILAALPGGGFAATWTGTDASGAGVRAQLYAPGSGAPTDIALSSATLDENAFENEAVGTLSSVGAVNSGFSYAIVGDTTGGAFRIEGDRLVVDDNAKLDFETAPQVTVTIRATDANGQTYDEAMVLDIADIGIEKRYSAEDEFVANATTDGLQGGQIIVPLTSGGFALFWNEYNPGTATNPNPNSDRTVLRLYGADGAPVSGEITLATKWLSAMTVAPLANGGFVIARNAHNEPEGIFSVKAQTYDSGGNPVGAEMVAGSGMAMAGLPHSPTIVQLSSGGFVMSWTTPENQVHFQLFDAAGAKVGEELGITAFYDSLPISLAATPSGGFVASWLEPPTNDQDTQHVRAQTYDAIGNPIGTASIAVAGHDAGDVTAIALAGGGYILGWTEEVGSLDGISLQAVMSQRLDAGGAPVGTPAILTAYAGTDDFGRVSFAAHPDGGFLAVWPMLDPSNESFFLNGVEYRNEYDEYGSLFDPSGAPVGSLIHVSERGGGNAMGTVLADGTIAVSWQALDDANYEIFARVYRPANEPGDIVLGSGGDNHIVGTMQRDVLHVQQGGNDSIDALDGNDTIYFGQAFTPLDTINGGGGTDSIILDGNYPDLVLGTGTTSNIAGIETISLAPAAFTDYDGSAAGSYSYDISSVNVAAGAVLKVNGFYLGATENFTFDGSAEIDGKFILLAGQGIDNLTGGNGNDIFVFGHDGRFGPSDVVSGGIGYDSIYFRGDFSLDFTAVPGTFSGIESITLGWATDSQFASGGDGEFDYAIVWDDAMLAEGATITVNGSGLAANETMVFNGSDEAGGHFRIFAGASNDTVSGGGGNDLIYGGRGADQLRGNGGADTFRYQATNESPIGLANIDTILDFTHGVDRIDVSVIDAKVAVDGDQAFTFIGAATFSAAGPLSAGELRAHRIDALDNIWQVEGDTDGDGVADLVLRAYVDPLQSLTVTDIFL